VGRNGLTSYSFRHDRKPRVKFENDIIGSMSGHRTPGVEIKSVTVPNDRAKCGIIRGTMTT
jgi:hypothetical protein